MTTLNDHIKMVMWPLKATLFCYVANLCYSILLCGPASATLLSCANLHYFVIVRSQPDLFITVKQPIMLIQISDCSEQYEDSCPYEHSYNKTYFMKSRSLVMACFPPAISWLPHTVRKHRDSPSHISVSWNAQDAVAGTRTGVSKKVSLSSPS